MDSCMGLDSIPINGFFQPGNGEKSPLALPAVARKSSKKTPADNGRLMRRIVADNIKQAMEAQWPGIKVSTQWEKLAAKAGVSASTIERIVKQQTGPSIDTLEDIARALKTPAPLLFLASAEIREAVNVTSLALENPGQLHRLPNRSATSRKSD